MKYSGQSFQIAMIRIRMRIIGRNTQGESRLAVIDVNKSDITAPDIVRYSRTISVFRPLPTRSRGC